VTARGGTLTATLLASVTRPPARRVERARFALADRAEPLQVLAVAGLSCWGGCEYQLGSASYMASSMVTAQCGRVPAAVPSLRAARKHAQADQQP